MIRDSTKPESIETVARRMWAVWSDNGSPRGFGASTWERESDEIRDSWRTYARAALSVGPVAEDEGCRDAWVIERAAISDCLRGAAVAASARSRSCTGTLDDVRAIAASALAYREAAHMVETEEHARYRRFNRDITNTAARSAAGELRALAALIERPPLDDVQLTQDVALRVAAAIRIVLAAREDVSWRLDRIREDGGPPTLADKAVLRDAADILGGWAA